MGIRNSLRFEADMEGTRAMFKEEARCREVHYCCIDEGMDARRLSERKYFKNAGDIAEMNDSSEKKKEKKKKWWSF